MERLKLPEKAGTFFKKYGFAIAVVLVGLVLMGLPGEKETPSPVQLQPAEQEVTLQEQLETVLQQLSGAGKVRVLLTQAAGSETKYQTQGENDQTVVITDSQRNQIGLIRQVIGPEYLGAVVLCQGGNDPSVRLAIVDAVSKLTGLGADKISVLKMK